MELPFIRNAGIRRAGLYLFYPSGQGIYWNDPGDKARAGSSSYWKISIEPK